MKQSYDYVTYRDFDYSNDSTIDSRVLQVCAKAEANYLLSQSMNKSLPKDKKDELYFKKLNESSQKLNQASSYNIQNNDIPGSSITKANLQQQPQKTANFQINPNETLQIKQNNQKHPFNYSYQMNKDSSLTQRYSQKKNIDPSYNSVNLKLLQSSRNSFAYKDEKTVNNYKPLLFQPTQKKIVPHETHITAKQKMDLNKTLLEAKTLMKKYKFISAYSLLKSTIQLGIYHSDLFYLYGEVNRIMKNLKEAEDYLLLALNFEMHSPYVFYSLGLLYQEISQFKYSNIFFKLFLQLIDKADAHFQMAKNYSQIGKYIKTAEELTKAINLNKEEIEYYKFRAEIYKLIGLTEMANDDEKMVEIILKSNYLKDR